MSTEIGANLATTIAQNLSTKGEDEATARKVGNSLSSIEDKLMKMYSDPKADQGKLKSLEVQYQRALRTFQAFMELMRNANEIMLRAIQNLRIG